MRPLALVICCIIVCLLDGAYPVFSKQSSEPQYLLFQIFVADVSPVFPSQRDIDAIAKDVIAKIGTTGNTHHKLGFTVGPLSFNQSDNETIRLIRESFKIARENNVAIAFHIDSHIFWDKQSELYGDRSNIEWIDWKETRCTGARLDWGPEPFRAPAQMCLNSKAIKAAVTKRAHLIGTEIKQQCELLKLAGKDELFAGIMAGWETRIARDFLTNRTVGFHALSNRGLSATASPRLCDAELVKVVREYIEKWSCSLTEAGIPRDKIYTHIAFTPQGFEKMVWIFAKVFSFQWIVPIRMADTVLLWLACALAFPYIECYFSVSDYLAKFDLKAVSFTPLRSKARRHFLDDVNESTVIVKTLLLNKALASSSYLRQHPFQESQGVRSAQIDLSETETLQMTIKPDVAGNSTVIFRYFDSSQSFR